ncbi:MAG: heavy-metal-associated domain-containing protein [Phycisphaerales bacterium]|nr:MAG: heavy-metal-associated domain-containing protein [Phycisphaerales bacterium]
MRNTLPMFLLIAAVGVMPGALAGCETTQTASSADRQASGGAAQLDAGAAGAEMIVYGMTCPFCATNLEKSLTSLDGVEKVQIDLNTGRVVVQFGSAHPTEADLRKAVADSGFTLHEIRLHQPAGRAG